MLVAQMLNAQTFTGPGGAIVDSALPQVFPITVSGLPTSLDTVGFGLEQICLDIQFDWVGDLELVVSAPDGTTAFLVGMDGGATGTALSGTCFRNDAVVHMIDVPPPHTGTQLPAQRMAFNNGQDPNGDWTLHVKSLFPGQTGTVLGWTLEFGSGPMHHPVLQSSDLPIVVITTAAIIPDEPKVPGTIGIINNPPGVRNQITDPFTGHEGRIGIEQRGILSQFFPKKSYSVEFWDMNDGDTSVAVLGMPAESDWVLSANYVDKSMLNNALAFGLGRQLGAWAPRTRHVELVLNGTYLGTYVFTEKIKRDAGRVDIANLQPTDIAGDELTGGYIVKLDPNNGQTTGGWTSPFLPPGPQDDVYIDFRYDEPSDPQPAQEVYIREHITAFETALNGPDFLDPVTGYAPFIDQRSFIDHMIVNELAKNVDAYRRSTFVHKDKDSNGGRLRMGPLWDFDLAFGNADFCEAGEVSGWAYNANYVCAASLLVPFWWWRLQDDPGFNDSLRCRWDHLRNGPLHTDSLLAWCDTMAVHLEESQQRNYLIWPTLGYYTTGNPAPYPTTYGGEIQELKDWLVARSAWLDANWPLGSGACNNAIEDGPRSIGSMIHPNPFTDHVLLPSQVFSGPSTTVCLLDPTGRTILRRTLPSSGSPVRLDLQAAMPPGPYLLKLLNEAGQFTTVLVKE